jgi:flagellum-specific peptidoglycan hydrolase FlgJ
MEEYSAGKTSVIYDYFRVYKTPAAGIKGFFEFIDTPRYANLKNVKDPDRYVELVKKVGYATSSSYVSVLTSIIRYNNLKAYDPY